MRQNWTWALVFAALAAGLFPVERAAAQCELSKHQALDAATGDDFGGAVAIDGDVIVIGAPEDDDAGSSSGAAYVFRFDGTDWAQEQKLSAFDADNGDDYGISVAVSGDTIIVGANRDDLPGMSRAGSAYVYRFVAGSWQHEAHLTAQDAAADDRFGSSVAIDGDTLVVGATHDDDGLSNAGAGYVFTRSGTVWTQQDKLTADMPTGTNPHVGRSASIDGDVVVLGAWQAAPAGQFTVGAAYVFRRDGDTWPQEQKLTASDAADFSQYGQAVSISDPVIAVGAPREHAEGPSDSGAAYFYRWNGVSWDEEDKVKATGAQANDRFGWSISLAGESAVIGTDTSSTKAYLFAFVASEWSEQAMLTSTDADVSSEYAYSVGLAGDTAVIGDRNGAAGTGLAFIFESAGPDCNDNGFCDSRDIAEGDSPDDNGNGIPDECEGPICGDCPTDVDGSGSTGAFDLAVLLGSWGPCAPGDACGCLDDNGDGVIGAFDLAVLLGSWGPCQ